MRRLRLCPLFPGAPAQTVAVVRCMHATLSPHVATALALLPRPTLLCRPCVAARPAPLPATPLSARKLQQRLAVSHSFFSYVAVVNRDGNLAAFRPDPGVGGPTSAPVRVISPQPAEAITTAPLWGRYDWPQRFYVLTRGGGLEMLVEESRGTLELVSPMPFYDARRQSACLTSDVALIVGGKWGWAAEEAAPAGAVGRPSCQFAPGQAVGLAVHELWRGGRLLR